MAQVSDPLQAGAAAARELADALKAAGFTFPSLTGDFPVMDQARVRLGAMSATEATRLATWLREHV